MHGILIQAGAAAGDAIEGDGCSIRLRLLLVSRYFALMEGVNDLEEIRQDLGEQFGLFTVTEPKFKTGTLTVMLLLPIIPEKNAAYALALSLLTQSCRKYPDTAAMTVRLDNMYGASLNSSVSVNGNVMQLMISGSTIANRYALHGENLAREMSELICDCILDPNAENGAFKESEFKIQKQELLDTIDAEINNKRNYAFLRAKKTAFAGEPDAYPVYGTREDALRLTSEEVYAAYEEILRRAAIRIYYVGPEPEPQLAETFSAAFAGRERSPEPLVYYAPSPCKPEPVTVREPMDVTQSKLVMVFKGSGLPTEAFRMMSAVFGGTPFSLLFMNVRERLSLCYYCSSWLMTGKDAMVVNSGVELANAERAKEAILEQLAILRQGDFDDALLENIKQSMVNALRSIGDTPNSCISDMYERFYRQDDADVETRIQRYLAITKEDVSAAARAVRLDTVYLMQQEGDAQYE